MHGEGAGSLRGKCWRDRKRWRINRGPQQEVVEQRSHICLYVLEVEGDRPGFDTWPRSVRTSLGATSGSRIAPSGARDSSTNVVDKVGAALGSDDADSSVVVGAVTGVPSVPPLAHAVSAATSTSANARFVIEGG